MKKQNAATMFKNPQLQESIIKQYKEAGLDFQNRTQYKGIYRL